MRFVTFHQFVHSDYSLKGIFCFDTRHNFLSKIIFEYHYRVISQETMGNSALKMKVGICERLMDRWSSKKKIHEVGENFSSHLLYLHFKTNHKTQRRIFLVPKGKRELTVFKNQIKSLIQHCERSELHFHIN